MSVMFTCARNRREMKECLCAYTRKKFPQKYIQHSRTNRAANTRISHRASFPPSCLLSQVGNFTTMCNGLQVTRGEGVSKRVQSAIMKSAGTTRSNSYEKCI